MPPAAAFPATPAVRPARHAALLLGIGLGGFVDGILLHQILHWHMMLSSRVPPIDLGAMQLNMRWDGLFHAAVWLATLAGVARLWAAARTGGALPSGRWFTGWLLLGWGLFNLVEGVINHHLLDLHHVRYEAMQWDRPSAAWDLGFLLVAGVGLIAAGWLMQRGAARQ